MKLLITGLSLVWILCMPQVFILIYFHNTPEFGNSVKNGSKLNPLIIFNYNFTYSSVSCDTQLVQYSVFALFGILFIKDLMVTLVIIYQFGKRLYLLSKIKQDRQQHTFERTPTMTV